MRTSKRHMMIVALAAGLLCFSHGTPAGAQPPLDVDDNGVVDPFTDLVYVARYLFGLDPVPPSFRTVDPEIDTDEEIIARIVPLVGELPTRTVTPTLTPTSIASPTSTRAPTSPSTPTPTPSRTVTLGTVTATRTPTRTPTPTRTGSPSPSPLLGDVEVIQAAAQVAVQNPESYDVISFGCLAVNCGESSGASSRFRLAAHRGLSARLPQGSGAQGVENCEDGTREIRCEDGVRRTIYVDCREAVPGTDHTVVRDGVTTLSVTNRDLCNGPDVVPEVDPVRVELIGYSQIERNASQLRVAEVSADLTQDFVPTREGCAGAEGTQTVDGSISYFCQLDAETVPCLQGRSDLSLTARSLVMERRAGGFPCELGMTVVGELEVEERLEDASYTQTFDGFLLTEADVGGAMRIKQDGRLSVDCLGGLNFATKVGDPQQQPGAILFPDDADCPTGGVLEVTRPPLVAGGAAGSGSGEPIEQLRHILLRSANGKVYQVLQNAGSEFDLGAEYVRITTLIGSEAGSVGNCANSAGATSDPQAVAAAEQGQAFPPQSVFKSARIPFVNAPCFSRSGADFDGRVCVGPACVPGTCVCPQGAACVAFTRAEGDPITALSAAVPPATLVSSLQPLADPCSGFEGRATYAFGSDAPTVQTRQCDPVPADGFTLPNGSSVVFAYDIPLTSLFTAGVGGFPVDEDGNNLIGCENGPNQVLQLGRSDMQAVPAPLITFLDSSRVQFDFDGDGAPEQTTTAQQRCRVAALSACRPSLPGR